MLRTNRKRVFGFTLAAAGILGAVALGKVGSAQTDEPTPIFIDAGYLAIETDPTTSNGRIAHYANDGTLLEHFSLGVTKSAKCRVDTAGVANLLGITAIDPAVENELTGLVSNGLGVRTKNTCSTDSGRVAPGQSIRFSLDDTKFGESYRIDYAEFDIEGKQNAVVEAATVNRSGTLVSYPLPLESNKASDNGPDAGAGDNSRETVGLANDHADDTRSITFVSSAASGQFAVEGGGDYGAANIAARSSKLYLVKDVFGVFCGESVSDDPDPGDAAVSAQVRRLANGTAPGKGECDEVEVEVEIREGGVFWNTGATGLNTGTAQDVKAEITIVWQPEAADVPMPPALINYEGNENGPFVEVQWCEEFDDVEGTWVHPLRVPAVPDNPATAIDESEAPWCLIDEHFALQDDGTVQRIETYHGQGDPFRTN